MGRGKVDLKWARAHHSLWVEKVEKNRPKDISGGPAVTPAE